MQLRQHLRAHMHVPLLLQVSDSRQALALLLHTSNTLSPMALLFLASLLATVPTPHPLVAASSPHHPNGRLVLHYTTPVWQNVAGSMHTTNNGTALTTLSRTPATSVELTCQNPRCGYAIKYSMAMQLHMLVILSLGRYSTSGSAFISPEG